MLMNFTILVDGKPISVGYIQMILIHNALILHTESSLTFL